jgi:uncharacterized RDD family membrane protein YckC
MTKTSIDGDVLNSKLQDTRAFEGVLTRRVFAFLIDYLFIGLLLIPVGIVVFLLGLLTFGLGWLLLPVLGFVVALGYIALTLGGPNQATPGMRITGVRMEMLDGRQIDWLLAMVHTVMFWAFNAALTPLILLVSWFTDGKRTLHDVLLGTVVVRDDV